MIFARTPWATCALVLLMMLAGCSSTTSTANATPTVQGGPCRTAPETPSANVRVSDDAFLAHSEPMVAEDPANPLLLVGGSKFFTNPAKYEFQIGSYFSMDGGCTWTDGGLLPGSSDGDLTSDVTFAYGPNHVAYVAVLHTNNAKESGIIVERSLNSGQTFGQPVTVFDDTTGRIFSDKPWIAVDNTNGPYHGAVYVAWSYDYQDCEQEACVQRLAFSRSTDGGQTFGPVQFIEGTAPYCTNSTDLRPPMSLECDAALGATPVILPDGTIAVVDAYITLGSVDPPTKLLVVTSGDGGATWSEPHLIATIHDIPSPFANETYRNAPLPAVGVDPKTGQLYVAWSDFGTGDSDILLSTSRDQGTTWSAPVRVNDDPKGDGVNQFQPQLAVAPDGVVSVSFFDTRNDPKHHLIDVYLAQSTTHGASFLKNIRVTTQSWDPNVDQPRDSQGNGFIGDYQGLAADNAFVHPFWNDTRTGAQEIFTAAIPSAKP